MRQEYARRMPLIILLTLCISVFIRGAEAQVPDFSEELPAEYELMQGIVVAWLPFGPIPDGPIEELLSEDIANLNTKGMSPEHSQGHVWKPAYSAIMGQKIKLKKGAGSPSTVDLEPNIYPYHYMMLDLVKAIIDSGAIAQIVVPDPSISDQLKGFMSACGYKMHDFNKIIFHYYDLDSIWTRDYGPWVTKTHNRLAVIDNAYYPERPADNKFPMYFSQAFDLPRTDFDQLFTEGGNILTDGMDRGFTTQGMLMGNPGLGMDDAKVLFETALNLDELVFLPGTLPENYDEMLAALGATLHVDMGLKILSDTKVIIGDFLPGSPGKVLLDAWADWFGSHTNPKGEPYEVFRVLGATDGFHPYSYVNSVVINKTIIVPQFGYAEGDAVALAAYAEALPDYKMIGVRSEILPAWSGGLHCITKEIPLGILKSFDVDKIAGPGADVEDRVNHDDLTWVNDGIGEVYLYRSFPDVTKTAPAIMSSTLGLPVGKENPSNFIVPWPDLSNADYLNPYNNLPCYGYLSYNFLLNKFLYDWTLRNNLLFPEEPKSAIEQTVYMNSEITVISIGTSDLAAWNGYSNTPPELFGQVMDGVLQQLSAIDPGKKIVLTTPLNYGAILIAVSRYYGQEPSPLDVEEDAYAAIYADIIKDRVANANIQGMDVAVADFTDIYRKVASGTVIGGIPLNIGNLGLLVDMNTWTLTDFSSALHAYLVIDAINKHYGMNYPLPELTFYITTP